MAERPEVTGEAPQGMCLDKGYDYDEVRAILGKFGRPAHIRLHFDCALIALRAAGVLG